MQTSSKNFSIYTIVICLSVVAVLNPVVTPMFAWSSFVYRAYMLALDVGLLAIVLLCVLHIRSQDRRYLRLSVAAIALLPLGLVAAEFGLTYYSVRYYNEFHNIQTVNIYRPDAVLGWSTIPNAKGHHVSGENFDVFYQFDEKGRKAIPQTEGLNRTLHFFGDSFTFGYGVSNEDTALNMLAANNRDRFNVQNYSATGYGVEQMFLQLRMNADEFRPGDIVVFALTAWSLEMNLIAKTWVCAQFWENSKRLPAQTFPIHESGRWRTANLGEECDVIEMIMLSSNLPFGTVYQWARNRSMHPKLFANADQVLAQAARLVEAHKGRFLLLFLAEPEECLNNKFTLDPEPLKTPFVSLMPICSEQPETMRRVRFPADSHWTPEGNRWAAGVIQDILFKKFPDLKSVAAR